MLYGKYPLKTEVGELPPPPPAITVNIPSRPVPSFSSFVNEQRFADAVTACLIGEAGGEGRMGMEAVLEVIRNRARAKYKNDSIISMYKIVTAPKQFSYFNSGIDTGVARAKKHPKWKEAQKILAAAPTNHTKGSTHYYAASLKTLQPWIIIYNKLKVPKVRVGNHIFYYNIPKGY
jgi:spore germination cell wall hydrolase CwlJ-like protein